MADQGTPEPLASVTEPNAGNPAVPSSINMPDHWVRQQTWFQVFVRLARPSLDWATIAWFVWVTIIEPAGFRHFDPIACGMCLAWSATVYGFKYAEKIKGVA